MTTSKRPTAAQVRSARKMAADGCDIESIATVLDLGIVCVSNLIYGKTYAYITDPPPLQGRPIPQNTNGIESRIDNVRLRAIRVAKLTLTQEQFAQAIQRECVRLGHTNTKCTKRHVQRWESGETALPALPYREAIARVTGESFTSLCEPSRPPDVRQVARDLEPLIQQAASLHMELLKLQRYLMVKPTPISPDTHAAS